MTDTATGRDLALEMKGIEMSFARNRVLKDVNFSVSDGSIQALVGHNGAGKSTLMKIALGGYAPDHGTVRIGGRPLTFSRPAEARRLGLGMVMQERSLIPTISGLDNLFLNSEHVSRGRTIRRRSEMAEAEPLLESLQISKRLLRTQVSSMSLIEQELIEIAKALRTADKVLILDEPTAPLGRSEIDRLFGVLRAISQRGTGIILVTHHMPEVFDVCDHVTCMREGTVVLSCPTSETNISSLITTMLGPGDPGISRLAAAPTTPREEKPRDTSGPAESRPDLLVATGVRSRHVLQGVNLRIAEGDIVGLAGLAGSGRSTFCQTLAGAKPLVGGSLTLSGQRYRPSTPGEGIRKGVFYVPEDRGLDGLMLTKSIGDNIVLPILYRLVNSIRVFEHRRAVKTANSIRDLLQIRSTGTRQISGDLSGGNQQKVVLGKALVSTPKLLILDEPTFGVDIGTSRQIIEIVRQRARDGIGVLWTSSDLVELLEVCDRIALLADGRISAFITRGDSDFNEATLLAGMQRGSALIPQ
jgi:ribose transport system ATP-binding protein